MSQACTDLGSTGAIRLERADAARMRAVVGVLISFWLAACGGHATDAPPPVADRPPPDTYRYLSQTELYADVTSKTFAPDLIDFSPTYALWSDGAVKRRFLRLPPDTQIDTSDPDHWRLPVGAQLFKEFRAPDGTLLETRLIEHVADTGSDDVDFWTGAFVWRADESDAVLTPEGAIDVNGTSYDAPAQATCRSCHAGEPGYALGLSHVQLSGPGHGMRLEDLAAAGLLTDPPASEFVTPGDPVTAGALGYLHANCGHCHNPLGAASFVGMTLRLSAEVAPETTAMWLTTVAMPTTLFKEGGVSFRVLPGDSASSALVYRMSRRGEHAQMPPIATELVDDVGVAKVSDWIAALPRE